MNANVSNSCLPIQERYPDFVDSHFIQSIFGIGYCIVLLFGISGSVLIAYCVLYKGIHMGIHTCFVLSLSCSDLLIALLSLPFTAVSIFTREWLFSGAACKIVSVFQASGIYVNSFTLAAIAIDRYVQVRSHRLPPTSPRRHGAHLLVVVFLWTLAIGASLPYGLLVMNQVRYVNLCGVFCEEDWPSGLWRPIYGTSTFAVQFVFPLAMLGFSYGNIHHQMAQSVRRQQQYDLSENARHRLRARRSRTVTILYLLCAEFIAPWLPYSLLILLRDFKFIPPSCWLIIFASVHLIAMTTVIWNPLIYCVMNKEFRDTLLRCIGMKREVRDNKNTPNVEQEEELNGI